MQKWEYLYAEAAGGSEVPVIKENGAFHPINVGGGMSNHPKIDEYLNEWGKQGWELVAVWPRDVNNLKLFLKRPKRDE